MNSFQIIGRLTADPVVKKVGSDEKSTALTLFTIAVDGIPNKDGERKADFLPMKAWGVTAANIGRFFHKGDRIAVTGSIHQNVYDVEYEDGSKEKRYETELLVNGFDFIQDKRSGEKEDLPFEEPKAVPKKVVKRR